MQKRALVIMWFELNGMNCHTICCLIPEKSLFLFLMLYIYTVWVVGRAMDSSIAQQSSRVVAHISLCHLKAHGISSCHLKAHGSVQVHRWSPHKVDLDHVCRQILTTSGIFNFQSYRAITSNYSVKRCTYTIGILQLSFVR